LIERPSGASARCVLVGVAVGRSQEIPVWMLDAAACRTMRATREPIVASSSLEALGSLLSKAMACAAASSPEAAIASRDRLRGDRHAPPPSPASTPGPPTRSLSRSPAAGFRPAPGWSALPEQTRHALIGLMTRLLMAHANETAHEPGSDADER
jgi:hypothetical protein